MEQSDAIVLRIYPWSETSCIANIYTRDFGKLSVLAKGARRPKSPFEAALDLLSICRVVFISKSADMLDVLTEAKLERRYRAASQGLLQLNCGYYVAELLDRLTDKGDKQPEIFELAEVTLTDLQNPGLEPRAVVLRFELQMLRMVGHLPSWQSCAQCGSQLPLVMRPDPGDAAPRRPEPARLKTPVADSDEEEILDTLAVPQNRTDQVLWRFFSPVAGGVLCESCRPGARQLMRLDPMVTEQFAYFSQPAWQEIEVDEYETDYRSIIRKIMVRYITMVLDRPLHLHAYLEELGR